MVKRVVEALELEFLHNASIDEPVGVDQFDDLNDTPDDRSIERSAVDNQSEVVVLLKEMEKKRKKKQKRKRER